MSAWIHFRFPARITTSHFLQFLVGKDDVFIFIFLFHTID